MSTRTDALYLGDMLDAARRAYRRVGSLSRDEFQSDEDGQIVAVHMIQIVGEAARRLSEHARQALPEIVWPDIIGMRHKIVHDYYVVDRNVVWDTVQNDLPPLIATLERHLRPQ